MSDAPLPVRIAWRRPRGWVFAEHAGYGRAPTAVACYPAAPGFPVAWPGSPSSSCDVPGASGDRPRSGRLSGGEPSPGFSSVFWSLVPFSRGSSVGNGSRSSAMATGYPFASAPLVADAELPDRDREHHQAEGEHDARLEHSWHPPAPPADARGQRPHRWVTLTSRSATATTPGRGATPPPASSTPGTRQPHQLTPGASALCAAALTSRWSKTRRRIGSTA